MLDIDSREHLPVIRNAEFFSIELAPQNDDRIFASLTATSVDDEDGQLLDQEIASQRVSTINDVVALIRGHVRVAAKHRGTEIPRFRNYYRCARCHREWSDEWSAMCDDDCPFCGARHMSPYKSEDAEEEVGND